ncbi:hypothetical protein WDW86_04450 [Bdellovibrionota bacterium FG-2]
MNASARWALAIVSFVLVFAHCSVTPTVSSAPDASNVGSCLLGVTQSETGVGVTLGTLELTPGGTEVAQSFVLASDAALSMVQLGLLRVGAPSGLLTLKVQGSSGSGNGAPDGVTLGSATYLVKAGTRYWLRLSSSYPLSDADHIKWAGNSSNPFSQGRALFQSSTPNDWTSLNLSTSMDLLFMAGCGECLLNNFEGDGSSKIGIAAANTDPLKFVGGSDVAQSFVAAFDTSISLVQLKLSKIGNPSGTLTLRVQKDAANTPDGATLATATLSYKCRCGSGLRYICVG